jgi:hypothetical protein
MAEPDARALTGPPRSEDAAMARRGMGEWFAAAALVALCALASAEQQPATASATDAIPTDFGALAVGIEGAHPEWIAHLPDLHDSRVLPYLRSYHVAHPESAPATIALAKLDDPDVIKGLLAAMRDYRPERKAETCETLAAVGAPWSTRLLAYELDEVKSARRVIPLLARVVTDPPTPALRGEASEAEIAAWKAWRAKTFPRDAIAWGATEATLRPAVEESSGIASFPFRNAGASTIEILAIYPACSCTTTSLDKLVYAPGEGTPSRPRSTSAPAPGSRPGASWSTPSPRESA